MTSTEQIVLRRAFPDDETQIALIAALDEEARPDGELLVAEVDGKIVAALSVDGRRSIADPFEPTAEVVQLLRSRARHLRNEHRIGRVRGWRPVRRSVKVAI
jgi:hypothetical protein